MTVRASTLRRALLATRMALVLAVASLLLGAGPAGGQATDPAPTLGGYTGSAAASGLHVKYAPEGLLPTGPPLDFGAPDALATIASGPATFARASVADPGDLLANPDALLALASSDYEAGTIPAYPSRGEASSGVGHPSAESNPAPGLNARATIGPGSAAAQATTPALVAPAVATVGSMASYATTAVEGSTVTVHARSEISGIDILGLVHIDSLVTDLTATSTGGETALEGGTTITGASVLGQPAVIDDQGIRAAAGGLDLSSVLGPLGITITLPGPVDLAGGSVGQLASTGLRIDVAGSAEAVPGVGDLLDSLPPIPPLAPGAPSVEDLLVAARARHLVSIEIGRGVVSLSARSPAPRPAQVGRPPPPAATPTGGAVTPRPATPAARPVPVPPAPVASSPSAPVLTTEVPAASVASGIGALAALLLLAQPFVGDRLARVAAAQLATDQEGCPWERR